jgi:flagellar motility protein MotE (MotC chaperone)
MMKMLKSGWVASLLGALLYLGTMLLVWRPPPPARLPETAAPVATAAANLDFRNPELDLLIEELKKEKEALAKKQSQLDELAERLRIERLELNQVTQIVHQTEAQFDSNVVRVLQEEMANLKKLARTYAGMSPEGAAIIFKQMDEMTLLRVLSIMKESETAPILEAMAKQSEADARRVAAISERLRVMMPNPKEPKRNL